jgi:hypothetical protein
MDHAFLMSRRATFDALTSRPSEIFQRHILVSPFPEESLNKVVEAVGTGCLAVGYGLTHSEGVPHPSATNTTQSKPRTTETQTVRARQPERFLGRDLATIQLASLKVVERPQATPVRGSARLRRCRRGP